MSCREAVLGHLLHRSDYKDLVKTCYVTSMCHVGWVCLLHTLGSTIITGIVWRETRNTETFGFWCENAKRRLKIKIQIECFNWNNLTLNLQVRFIDLSFHFSPISSTFLIIPAFQSFKEGTKYSPILNSNLTRSLSTISTLPLKH